MSFENIPSQEKPVKLSLCAKNITTGEVTKEPLKEYKNLDVARQDLKFERLRGLEEGSEEYDLESDDPTEQAFAEREQEQYRLNHEFYFEDENGNRVE
ncbi:MAG: hypothetical protein ACKKL4_01755 [Patescibacteria group bacterium]